MGKIFTDPGMTFGAQNTHGYGSGSPTDPLVPSPKLEYFRKTGWEQAVRGQVMLGLRPACPPLQWA